MRREKGSGSIYKRDGSPYGGSSITATGWPSERAPTQPLIGRKAGNMLKTRLSEINQGTFMGPQLERT